MAAIEAAGRNQRSFRPTRRGVIKGLGAVGLVGLAGALPRRALARRASSSTATIAVIGGGMAGLSAAYQLYGRGVYADIFEANPEPGGRVWSLGGDFAGDVTFPGQVVERGGELIDTTHTTMRGYATEFGLSLEDYDKAPGEPVFFVDGVHYEEADVVDEYRDFVAAMRADLRTLSPPTAESFNSADELLDYTTLEEYLQTRGAGDLLTKVLRGAYTGEYGRELDRQSSLNLLLFMHPDKSSNFREFGVYSDERFHIVGGNQQVPAALAATLSNQIQTGMKLTRLAKNASGSYALTFEDAGGGTSTHDYDYVVLAIPFSVLRLVDLDSSLGLPAWKTNAIQNLDYGTNTKMLVGFDGRPWAGAGSNGSAYAHGLDHTHNLWESNYSNASSSRGVLTNYSGGDLADSYDTSDVQAATEDFLGDLDQIFPGASGSVSRETDGSVRVHLEKWSENERTLGSYTNNHPGYFTTICELEGVPVDRLFFAGEHADSFYAWQGFMEGAANSGIAAATEILAQLR